MKHPIYTNQAKLVQTPSEVVLEFSAQYDETDTESVAIAMTYATFNALKELINKPQSEE